MKKLHPSLVLYVCHQLLHHFLCFSPALTWFSLFFTFLDVIFCVCVTAMVDSATPRLNTVWKYARVEMAPPSPAQMPQVQEGFTNLIRSARTQKWRQLTVKVKTQPSSSLHLFYPFYRYFLTKYGLSCAALN